MGDVLVPLVATIATAVALLGGWLSLRADRLVEDPDHQRRRRRGLAAGDVLAAATVAGALAVGNVGGLALRLLGLGLILGAFGVLGDRRRLRPAGRLAAEVGAGLLAGVVGLETTATAVTASSVALVVLGVVVVVESLRLLDSAPRAAAAVTAPATAGLALVAIEVGQRQIAILAIALTGALVGLILAGSRRPFWLGESGCLFAGILFATLAVGVTPATAAPLSLAVVVPLLVVPLFNATVVAGDRLRRRRPLTQRRPDGLAHRLRAMRQPWAVALSVLGGLEAVVAASVVLADRGIVPLATPALAAAGAVLVLLVPVRAGKVHKSKAPPIPLPVRLGAFGVATIAILLVGPAVVVLASARGDVASGGAAVESGIGAARQGRAEVAGDAFERAEVNFNNAQRTLDNPLATLGLAVPVIGPNLSAARTLAGLGADLAGTGAAVTAAASEGLNISGGAVPLEELRALAPRLVEVAGDLTRANDIVAGVDQAYLLPSVRNDLIRFGDRLERAAGEAEVAAEAAGVLPSILGGEGTRRYFLAVQNNAELRATGGFLGSYGELVAEDGRVRLERIGRIAELNESGVRPKVVEAPPDYLARYSRFGVATTWQNVNMSPDLPSVGGVIAGLYPQSGGGPIDGVIAIDPVGLAGILAITGAIEVEPWPAPITAENVVEVTLNQAYVDFDNNQDRIDFTGDVAEVAADAFTTADLGSPRRILDALGPPSRQGHLSAWFARPEEQALVERVGMAAGVEPVDVDSLLVVNQNAGGNKIDYYLRRSTSYSVQLRPQADGLGVVGSLQVAMENQAPAEGLPPYIIGPFDERFVAGENRSYVSLYSPFELTAATWEGQPLTMEAEDELGRRVYSAFLSIPARSTRTLEVQWEGTARLLPGGVYELDLLRQPLVGPEEVSVSVEVPEGWRIVEAGGATLESGQRAVSVVTLEQDQTLRLRLAEQDR